MPNCLRNFATPWRNSATSLRDLASQSAVLQRNRKEAKHRDESLAKLGVTTCCIAEKPERCQNPQSYFASFQAFNLSADLSCLILFESGKGK